MEATIQKEELLVESQEIKDMLDEPYLHIDKIINKTINENGMKTIQQLVDHVRNQITLDHIFPIDSLIKLIDKIPCINHITNYENLIGYNGKIIRYTIRIQDILDSEMHVGLLFEKYNNNIDIQTHQYITQNSYQNLKYRDVYNENLFSKYNMEEDCILMDRLNILGLPVSHQNTWIQPQVDKTSPNNSNITYEITNLLRQYFKKYTELKGFHDYDIQPGFPALIKFYEGKGNNMKLNTTIDLIGILQYDKNDLAQIMECLNNPTITEEAMADSLFPSCLFPRIHAICYKTYENGLNDLASLQKIVLNLTDSNILQGRDGLIELLNDITLNQNISELMILNMISTVYMKKNMELFGKFVLNITNSNIEITLINTTNEESSTQPIKKPFSTILYTIIQELLPTSLRLCCDRKSIESYRLIPKKSYDLNCLDKGLLQLANNTMLFLDETKLDIGPINEIGIKNIHVINQIIDNQEIPYDFHYHDCIIPTNLKVLILSITKSIFKNDFHVQLPQGIREIQSTSKLWKLINNEHDELFNNIRGYLIKCQQMLSSVILNQDIANLIQNDYVQERKENPSIDFDILNKRIGLAKLISASQTKTDVTYEHYKKACILLSSHK